MAISMYQASAPVFDKMLGNLGTMLGKAATWAEGRKIEPAVLMNARLAPDMFALTRQVQIACDFAKGTCARLAGLEPPKYEDNETTTIFAIKRLVDVHCVPLWLTIKIEEGEFDKIMGEFEILRDGSEPYLAQGFR